MRPKLCEGVVRAELADDELVVSTPDRQTAIILNPMGAAVLDLCDGEHTLEQIVSFLAERFADTTSEHIRSDVSALIDKLAAAALVVDTA